MENHSLCALHEGQREEGVNGNRMDKKKRR